MKETGHITDFNKPSSALLYNPLDKDAIIQMIRLWQRYNVMPKTVIKLYQVLFLYADSAPTINFSSTSEKEAREYFCEEVKQRFRDIHSEDDFDEEDATVEEMIENNAIVDEQGNTFDLNTAVMWVEGYYNISLVTTEIEI
jgi:hypothetical protein